MNDFEPIEAEKLDAVAKLVLERIGTDLKTLSPEISNAATYLLSQLVTKPLPPDLFNAVVEGEIIPEEANKFRGLARPSDRRRSSGVREGRIVLRQKKLTQRRERLAKILKATQNEIALIDEDIEKVRVEYISLNVVNLLAAVASQASALLAASRDMTIDKMLLAFAPGGDDMFYEQQRMQNEMLLQLVGQALETDEGRMVLREALVRGLEEMKSFDELVKFIHHKASISM